MRMTSILFIVALALLMAVPVSVLAATITTNIAYAKRDDLPPELFPDDTLNTYVVRGRITSPDFNPTVGGIPNLQVYFQDTSDNVGICMLFDPNEDFNEYTTPSELVLGREVEVKGVIGQFNGNRYIKPSIPDNDIVITDTNPVHPTPVLDTITNLLQNAEGYEGTLVVITNVTYTGTWPNPGQNGFLTADDGTASIDLFIDQDTNIAGQLPPTNAFTLQGIFSQYDTSTNNLPNGPNEGYQIVPRFFTDIIQDVPADSPPSLVLSPSGTALGGVGSELSIQMLGQDRNVTDTLTFGKIGVIGTVTDLGIREAVFTWTPPPGSEFSTNDVTLTVSDGLTVVSSTVTVIVQPIPTNFWDFEGWIQGWTTYSVASSADWENTDAYGFDPGAEGTAWSMDISGYQADTASDDWLISPELDLSTYTVPRISYFRYYFFTGPVLKLLVSTDYPGTGDPSGYTWADLGLTLPPTGSDWYQEVKSLAAYAGNPSVYVAFQYTSDGPLSGQGMDWRVDQIRLEETPANVPPSFTPQLTDVGVVAGNTLAFPTRATEPNNDLVTMTQIGVPAGATYVVTNGLGEGTGYFSWTPTLADTGVVTVSFIATDVDGAETNDVDILVASPFRPCGLIISEYIEGSSNNKAVELYNGSPYEIDLGSDGYVLDIYANGNTSVSSSTALTGKIASGGTYLVVNSTTPISATLTNAADQFGAMFFNGDDALVLGQDASGAGTVIDSLGRVGEDPGLLLGHGARHHPGPDPDSQAVGQGRRCRHQRCVRSG